MLHKDIKPTNILIFDGPDGEPRPRLVDFGIGALADPAVLGQHGVTAAGFTRATIQHSTGTPTYSPPEYLAGRPYTIQGDICGLGVLLYQLVTAKANEPLAPGWERDVEDPLLREDIAVCVDGDPKRRLPSAAELAERLLSLDQRRADIEEEDRLARDAVAQIEAAAAAAEVRARQRRFRRNAAALLLLALVSIAAGWFGFRAIASRGPSYVKITTDPPGADVWRDGQRVGITPFSEKHQTARQIAYTLKSAGFSEYTYLGTLDPTTPLSLVVPLRPTGIETTPSGHAEKDYYGQVDEIENIVEVAHKNGVWTKAKLGKRLLVGDRIRTRHRSRATVKLVNGNRFRLDQFTVLEITPTLIQRNDASEAQMFFRQIGDKTSSKIHSTD